jgi:uncharacterized protein (TIGR01244 family)
MNQLKKNDQQLCRTPYSAIYAVLLLGAWALSGCAQQYIANSKVTSEGNHSGWLGATCSAALMPTDNLNAETKKFEICQPEIWGAAKNVVAVKHLYLSSQPDADTLEIAREKGVELVINLRDPGEFNWDEQAAAKKAALDYYNVPISPSGESFDPDAVNQITALIQQHKGQKTLLHCSSGNRASAWLAIHLANDHSMPSDTAISLAKQAGLTSPAIEARVLRYLQDTTRKTFE